jgi:hypothetical protein
MLSKLCEKLQSDNRWQEHQENYHNEIFANKGQFRELKSTSFLASDQTTIKASKISAFELLRKI